MTQTAQNAFDRSSIELLLTENKLAEALALLLQSAQPAPLEREASLYALLLRVRLRGPEYYEQEIDALRALTNFNDHEKTLVRRIFLYAFQIAEKAGDEEKKWAYQRLLRRLLLGQPLDQPVPITPKSPLLGRRLILLEPAAIVPTPIAITGQRAPKVSTVMDMIRSLAVVYGAVCLLAAPMVYLASSIVYEGNRSAFPPARSTRAPASARVYSGTDGMSAPEERPIIHRFDEEQIKKSLQKQLSGLRYAYARWSAKERNARGSVSLKVMVDGRGKVVAVNEVLSELPDAGFIQTVIGEARKWQLPIVPVEASEITIPLLFLPKITRAPRIVGWQQASRPEPGGSVEKTAPVPIAAVKVKAAGGRETIAASQYNRAEQPESLRLDYVARRVVALREEPRFASSTLEEILPGTRMSVVAVEGDWFKVRTAHSRNAGFVRKEFVVPVIFGR